MDARGIRPFAALACALLIAASLGAGFQTPNFEVQASNAQLAERIGRAAEKYRHILAVAWTGKPMPDWSARCPISAKVSPNLGAGGETSFLFDRGEVYGWKMMVQGSEERVLDSVLPHEVTHTIFASYFRRPLPRWADEGACTTMEHDSERGKQHRLLYEFLRTERGIPFSEMFAMKQYPRDILPLYAQGYSLARYLIQQGGRNKYVKFLGEGMEREQWAAIVKKHYGYASLGDLQTAWLKWVEQGSPQLATAEVREGTPTLEDALEQPDAPRRVLPVGTVIYRGQNEPLAGERDESAADGVKANAGVAAQQQITASDAAIGRSLKAAQQFPPTNANGQGITPSVPPPQQFAPAQPANVTQLVSLTGELGTGAAPPREAPSAAVNARLAAAEDGWGGPVASVSHGTLTSQSVPGAFPQPTTNGAVRLAARNDANPRSVSIYERNILPPRAEEQMAGPLAPPRAATNQNKPQVLLEWGEAVRE